MNFPNVMLPAGPMAYADVGSALEQCAVGWHGSPLDPRRLEGPDRRQGRAHGRRCAAGGGRGGGRRSSCRTTAGVSSTAWRRRCACCPRWSRPSAIGPRCCSTAASAAAATSSRRWRSARAPSSSAARTSTGWAPAGGPGVTRAIEILRADLLRTLKLLGCASTAELDRSFLELPSGWPSRRGDRRQANRTARTRAAAAPAVRHADEHQRRDRGGDARLEPSEASRSNSSRTARPWTAVRGGEAVSGSAPRGAGVEPILDRIARIERVDEGRRIVRL